MAEALTSFEWIKEAGALGLVVLILIGVWRLVSRLLDHKTVRDNALHEMNMQRDRSYQELVNAVLKYGLGRKGPRNGDE